MYCTVAHEHVTSVAFILTAIFTRTTLATAGRCVSVCLSVHLSVTSQCSTEMAKRRIMPKMRHDSPGTLVF